MKTIHRYVLELTDEPTALIPLGAQVLSVSTQRGRLEMWAVVDTAETVIENRAFYVVGTGNPMPSACGAFIGTVMVHDGALVFHVFEAGAR